MADKMNWIDALPIDVREEIIHDLSERDTSNLVPLTINANVYWIPPEVNFLIESLGQGEINELNGEIVTS
jgi:hypothetical protein|tara:strand:+ start:98 stop:307 length:210 start_codon:yes stop_codon:yes gene_type:complete